jgi:hypothetical protein
MKPVAKLLQQYCNMLLQDNSSWAERKDCLEHMHALFAELGALNAYDEANHSPAKVLDSGTAIAPAWAAMCMFDIARTRQFVLGLREAVTDRLSEQPDEPIQVLDAGCGPYGLLSLLAAQYFSPSQVQFTLLDIFPGNIESAQKLITALGMQHYFRAFVCEDALHYQWPSEKSLHILVTETMNRALWKEPQVAISLHLAPQLAPGAVLIPERIEVSLVCVNLYKKKVLIAREEPEALVVPALYEEDLGRVLELDKNSTAAGIAKKPLFNITLPGHFNTGQYQLELHTRVQVYKWYELKNEESAVSLSQVLSNSKKENWKAGDELSFYYEQKGEPAIVCTQSKGGQ